MLRFLVSTARRQRFVALLGVITLAIAVPPAFGGSSVATQIAKALKLAKTANATAVKANTNAAAALKLAKASSGGTAAAEAGAKGATGDKGANGAAGANGATGPAGPAGAAGAAGAKGDTGAKGDKGDTGAKGEQGIPGPAATTPAGGSAGGGKSISGLVGSSAVAQGNIPITSVGGVGDPAPLLQVGTVADTAYVVTAHTSAVVVEGGNTASIECALSSGTTILDHSDSFMPYGGQKTDLTLTAVVPATSTADPIKVTCTQDSDGKTVMAHISLTGISVAS